VIYSMCRVCHGMFWTFRNDDVVHRRMFCNVECHAAWDVLSRVFSTFWKVSLWDVLSRLRSVVERYVAASERGLDGPTDREIVQYGKTILAT
jgi:hypothetical protein